MNPEVRVALLDVEAEQVVGIVEVEGESFEGFHGFWAR